VRPPPLSHGLLRLARIDADDLWEACGGNSRSEGPTWDRFLAYVTDKERELYKVFHSLDAGGDDALDKLDLRRALDKAGLKIGPEALDGFVAAFDRDGDGKINFQEWSEILLLLPRATSLDEIFRFYAASNLPRHTSTQLTLDADVVPTENSSPPRRRFPPPSADGGKGKQPAPSDEGDDGDEEEPQGLFAGVRASMASCGAGTDSRTGRQVLSRWRHRRRRLAYGDGTL
jgi:solute carrier family 25 phosphate transporter 23/24/25/41